MSREQIYALHDSVYWLQNTLQALSHVMNILIPAVPIEKQETRQELDSWVRDFDDYLEKSRDAMVRAVGTPGEGP